MAEVPLKLLMCLLLFGTAIARMLPMATLETLQALDTDGSGHVEKSEIESFAKAQGLDIQKALMEFGQLDKNGDGELDLQELGASFGEPASTPKSAPQRATSHSQSDIGRQAATAASSSSSPFGLSGMINGEEEDDSFSKFAQGLPAVSTEDFLKDTMIQPRQQEMQTPRATGGAGEHQLSTQQQIQALEQQIKQLEQQQPQPQQEDEQQQLEQAMPQIPAVQGSPQANVQQTSSFSELPEPQQAVAGMFGQDFEDTDDQGEQTAFSIATSAAAFQVPAEENQKPSASQNASAWLETSALDARRLAAKTTAEAFARAGEKVLAHRSQDEADAEQFEAVARSLRANATALLQRAAFESEQAAAEAVGEVTKDALVKLRKLEADANKAETAAITKHSMAQLAMARALKAQADISASVKRLRTERRQSLSQLQQLYSKSV